MPHCCPTDNCLAARAARASGQPKLRRFSSASKPKTSPFKRAAQAAVPEGPAVVTRSAQKRQLSAASGQLHDTPASRGAGAAVESSGGAPSASLADAAVFTRETPTQDSPARPQAVVAVNTQAVGRKFVPLASVHVGLLGTCRHDAGNPKDANALLIYKARPLHAQPFSLSSASCCNTQTRPASSASSAIKFSVASVSYRHSGLRYLEQEDW